MKRSTVSLFLAGMIALSTVAPAAFGQATPQQNHRNVATPWTPRTGGTTAPTHVPSVAGPSLNTSSWTAIGPASLTSGSTNGLVSGRVAGIAADPTNANIIYAVPAGGGVWKTTDGGSTWTELTDTQSTLSMGAIAVAPTNPLVIYAGTGEANNSLDSNYGLGILTSTDGGGTWTLRTGPSNAFNRLTTSQIAVDPANSSIAYAAMADLGVNGLSGSNTGIWKTTDGGANWTNTTATIDSVFPWSAIVIDPNNNQNLYAAIGYYYGTSSNGIYRSLDGGGSWSLLANGPHGLNTGRIALALGKSNSSVLYAAVQDSNTFGQYGMFRSDNANTTATFTTLSATPNFLGGQGWYDIVVAVDPANSANVYAAGVVNYNNNTDAIIKSTNSGVSWTDITTGSNGVEPHTDNHALAFDATGHLLDGNDGGVYRYDPGNNNWTDLNSNINSIQFIGIGLHPTNPNIAIGGSQDNGTELFSGVLLWTETDGGDGGFAKFSQTNGSRAYHQIPVASFGTNFFRRSDDGGNTWTTETSSIFGDTTQNFYAPFVVDPNNGDHVFYGTYRVWETTTGGSAWSLIGNTGSNGFNNNGNNVDAIGLAPSDPINTVYVATGGTFASTSQIFVTTNHGGTWTERDLPVGNGRVNDIQVDPNNSLHAYAVINQFNGANGQVFETTSGGASWSSISGNLPVEPAWSLQIGPGTLYVGADDGVYSSTDDGHNWSRFGTGFPHAQAFQLELNNNLHILGAATHGRGLWEISTAQTPSTMTSNANTTPQSAKVLTAFATALGVTVLDASNKPVSGVMVTFTAPTTGASGKFTDTGTNATTATTNVSGVATASTFTANATANPNPAVPYNVVASATGVSNVNFALTNTSAKAATSTTLVSSVNPSAFGQLVTFTATVTTTTGTPTGTVTFKNGTATLGTGTLSAGTAAFKTATLTVGTHSITAVYSGDASFAGSTSPALSQTVNQAASTTSVVSSVNPSTSGQAVTFTATVKSATTGTPTGTVTFNDGATPLGTGTLSGGKATFTTTALALGSHSITASYGGNANFTASTSTTLTQTVKSVSSTTVASSLNPSAFGQLVTFTATVTATTGTPTGTVTFKNGTATLGTGTLSAGTVAFKTATLTVGTHSITAVYSGDASFAGSTSPALSQTVNQAASTTSVVSSVNPSTSGQAVTFTATVKSATTGTPTGTVTFNDGATPLGTGTLSGGKATFTTTALALGSHSITASYGGNANFTASTSTTLTQTVKSVSSTTVASSLNPSAFGQLVTFTATVTATTGTPTGTVTFKNGTATLGTGTLSAGTAAFKTATLTVGTHSITAVYSGDASFAGSTSPALSQTVNQAASTTSVVSSVNPSTSGQAVTFTATVKSATTGTPTGTVTFNDGATPLGTGTLSGGKATFTTTALALGSHSITASYGGNANFTASTSTTLKQTVN